LSFSLHARDTASPSLSYRKLPYFLCAYQRQAELHNYATCSDPHPRQASRLAARACSLLLKPFFNLLTLCLRCAVRRHRCCLCRCRCCRCESQRKSTTSRLSQNSTTPFCATCCTEGARVTRSSLDVSKLTEARLQCGHCCISLLNTRARAQPVCPRCVAAACTCDGNAINTPLLSLA